MHARLRTRPRRQGSPRLGAAMVAAAALTLAACVALPPETPDDPAIPTTASPAFTDLAPPPTTNGPTEPPVPTTAPGDFAYGETVVIHTERGSTWEVTALRSIDPADSLALQTGSTPRANERFVVLELEIENVGVITTHPMHDMTIGYQPDGAPLSDQNSASTAAAPNDLGYVWDFAPGDRESVQVIVAVRDDAATTGSWVFTTNDRGTLEPGTVYRFG
ncbi:hypothetical protein FQ330_10980 [Agrococcus sediminis]|uniref:DUF4352 domain-containing protein n=1 Tax=Agrococcus sediminis TaxID=2599924 RepID=A0A5M8Q863_9MICO|nr:hypothetical protein [Agrococcus sediminis]KAA6431281.1 hypothetical protein FQ330_10980 [Agrococcus sediminis]RWR25709.1 hypothetical protein D8Y24_00915 [Agrococcus lahaulensis]